MTTSYGLLALDAAGVNAWMGVAGVVLGVAGLAFGIYSHSRNRVVSALWYATDEDIRLDPHEPAAKRRTGLLGEVSVQYRGEPVSVVSRAYVGIMNRGTRTLRRDDHVAKDPLRITCRDGGIVLNAAVIKITRDANGLAVRPNPSREGISIDFDYLERNDGGVIEVLHTGGKGSLHLEGSLMDVPSLSYRGQLRLDRPHGLLRSALRSRTMLTERLLAVTGMFAGFAVFITTAGVAVDILPPAYLPLASVVLGMAVTAGVVTIIEFLPARRSQRLHLFGVPLIDVAETAG